MKGPYEDIINLPHHRSSKHPHMLRQARAAQFAPFAALTGHEAAINEVARITDKRIQLDKYIKEDINKKLSIIEKQINDKLEVSIIYFQEDKLKDGGQYLTLRGYVKKIDKYEELLVMNNGIKIQIKDIVKIQYI